MGFNSAFKGLTNLTHEICFTISLFHASTCFEHHALIVRRSEIVLYDLWYHHTCRWLSGAQFVHGTATYRV